MANGTHRTVILDAGTDAQLQRLNALCPVLSLHATHLAVVRAGLGAIGNDANMLMAMLQGHKGRLVSSRQAVRPSNNVARIPESIPPTKLRSLIDAMRPILGDKSMDAPALYAALKTQRQLPFVGDPLGWIRYALSTTPNVFRHVEGMRGHFELYADDPLRLAASSAETTGNSCESDTLGVTELQRGTLHPSLATESDEFDPEPATADSGSVPDTDIAAAPPDSRCVAATSLDSPMVD